MSIVVTIITGLVLVGVTYLGAMIAAFSGMPANNNKSTSYVIFTVLIVLWLVWAWFAPFNPWG